MRPRQADAGEATAAHPALDYDTVVLGASPLTLLEAATLASEGRRVLVADPHDRIGGAWSAISLPGIEAIERSCHVVLPNPGAYELLARLGVAMRPLEPGACWVLPRRVLGRRLVPYENGWPRYTLRRTWTGRLRGRFGPHVAWLRWTLSPRTGLKSSEPLRYPVGGSQEIVDTTVQIARDAGVEIRVRAPAADVQLGAGSRGPVRIELGDRAVTASQLLITSTTPLATLRAGDVHVELPREGRRFVQLHLVFESLDRQRLSFLHFTGSPLVKLVTDLTDTSIFAKRKTRVLAVWAHDDTEMSDASLAIVLDELRELGMVGAGEWPVEHHWAEYPIPYRSPETLAALERRHSPALRTLETRDFGYSLGANAARWSRAFKGSRV